MKRYFTGEDTQMTTKYIKICSISLATKKIQLKIPQWASTTHL